MYERRYAGLTINNKSKMQSAGVVMSMKGRTPQKTPLTDELSDGNIGPQTALRCRFVLPIRFSLAGPKDLRKQDGPGDENSSNTPLQKGAEPSECHADDGI
jgi:hypothetical protein